MATSYSLLNTVPTGDSASPKSEGVAASSTNTYYSKMWTADNSWNLEVVTSGTLTGTWTLWTSSKERPSEADDTDWVDISSHPGFVETNPSGSTTKWSATPDRLPGRFRLKYVNASGTGNIYAYVFTH